MTSHLIFCLVILLTHNMLLNCASAAVHSHSVDNEERESDGSYRSRDHDHYSEGRHNRDFDHEAILGSVKEAEEFDRLSLEESKRRLSLLLPKMDLNGDQYIDHAELKKWIKNSFVKLAREEAEERLADADDNRDGIISWSEYLQDSFGVASEDELGNEDIDDTGMLLLEDKQMWKAADLNGDDELDITEFEVFTNPEEHEIMHPFLIIQTLREKDKDNDHMIDFQEYIGDRGSVNDKEWMLVEKDKFDHEFDLNLDGVLDQHEIHKWVIPDNDEIADEEAQHLVTMSDADGDERLSYAEVLLQSDLFVGSDSGLGALPRDFDDEL